MASSFTFIFFTLPFSVYFHTLDYLFCCGSKMSSTRKRTFIQQNQPLLTGKHRSSEAWPRRWTWHQQTSESEEDAAWACVIRHLNSNITLLISFSCMLSTAPHKTPGGKQERYWHSRCTNEKKRGRVGFFKQFGSSGVPTGSQVFLDRQYPILQIRLSAGMD